MDFVNKQNNVVRFRNLGYHSAYTLLKIAAVFRARHHCGKLQRPHLLIEKRIGHITLGNAKRESLDRRRLAHSRLTDKARIVFCSPAQNTHDAVYFPVAAHNFVDAPRPRCFRETNAVFCKRAGRYGRRLTVHFSVLHGKRLRRTERAGNVGI